MLVPLFLALKTTLLIHFLTSRRTLLLWLLYSQELHTHARVHAQSPYPNPWLSPCLPGSLPLLDSMPMLEPMSMSIPEYMSIPTLKAMPIHLQRPKPNVAVSSGMPKPTSPGLPDIIWHPWSSSFEGGSVTYPSLNPSATPHLLHDALRVAASRIMAPKGLQLVGCTVSCPVFWFALFFRNFLMYLFWSMTSPNVLDCLIVCIFVNNPITCTCIQPHPAIRNTHFWSLL